jgi:hypothetical protein
MTLPGLNDFASAFAQALFEAFPWLRDHARLHEVEGVQPGSLLVEFDTPPPRKDCTFWITTDQGEITVGFGMFHAHFAWPRPAADDWWEDPLDFIRDLTEDRLLVEDWTKGGKWSGSSTLAADAEPDLSGLMPDHVVLIRSWSGRLDRTISGAPKSWGQDAAADDAPRRA